MNMPSIPLSYLFLALALISFIFFMYFKILRYNISEKSSRREKIIGEMRNVDEWKSKNNRMSFLFLFWSIISLGVFIYIKYFLGFSLVSGIYVIAYLALIVISCALFGIRRKTKA